MATSTIQLKRNTTNIIPPVSGDLVVGEIAVSAVDGKLYIKTTGNVIKAIDASEDDAIALAIALG
jgi:DNA-binding beta-propeller fold protein YncE|tara:strand:+ start:939 stop:1133 length:195 start_codon:yes stop_codon:yes gene_type:complete